MMIGILYHFHKGIKCKSNTKRMYGIYQYSGKEITKSRYHEMASFGEMF